MSKKIHKLFNYATFEPDRVIGGVYMDDIPLQIYGEEPRLSVTHSQYMKFAGLILKECVNILQRGMYRNTSIDENEKSMEHIEDILDAFDMELDSDGNPYFKEELL